MWWEKKSGCLLPNAARRGTMRTYSVQQAPRKPTAGQIDPFYLLSRRKRRVTAVVRKKKREKGKREKQKPHSFEAALMEMREAKERK